MRGLACGVALLVLLALAQAAWGHASLVGSEPADRAVVAQPPPVVTLVFNEPVSPLALRLVGPDGRPSDLRAATAVDRSLTITMPTGLVRGTHLLSWRVISADGHPVGGALTFSVIEPSAEPPMLPQPDPDRPLQGAIWLGKLMLYVGLTFGVGGAFYAAWIARGPLPGKALTCVILALECGLAAAVISVGLQGADAQGLPLSEIRRTALWATGIATSFGATACLAAGAFVLALWALYARSHTRVLASLALAAAGAALAASGHAASAAPQLLMRPALFLHGVSVMFWVGALLPLLLALGAKDARVAELMRFSRAIPLAVAVLVVSGIGLAVVQLGALDALWTTSYGLVLTGKLCAVLVLLALGGLNRYALTPHVVAGDPNAATRLVTSIKLEIAIVAVVLGLVAMWRFTPPPRAALAVAASPVQVHLHAAAAMADLRFEPVSAGTRTVVIALWNGNFAPLAAKAVTLVLSRPDAAIEPLHMQAAHVGETTWRIESLAVPLRGRWRVAVEILVDDFEKRTVRDDVDFPR